jgi:1,4-alpha-glucan branching enzyme
MGATLVPGGATFKAWGPSAQAVYLNGCFGGSAQWTKDTSPDLLLTRDANGYWTGFLAGVADGDQYKFYVVGPPPRGTVGYKRDAYARELTPSSTFPFGVNCFVRPADVYPWHDRGFVTPDYSNLILYQLHVGTFAPSAFPKCGTFLDVITKIPYLASLGINLLQPLPITECKEKPDMGYDGADLFSPDSLYTINDPADLPPYLAAVNGLLAAKGLAPVAASQITSQPNQLKAMVDLCHVYGIAVNFDVIYNHAGGFDGDDEAIFFWDRQPFGDNNNSLYFTNVGMAGGLAFALWKREVRQFLIDNASFFLSEFHIDGFRYDEISKLLADTYFDASGWDFCRALTSTVRYIKPRALQNAEFWPSEYDKGSFGSMVQSAAQGGAGFDTVQHDGLRYAVRRAIEASSYGQVAAVNMDVIRDSLYPAGVPQAWNAVPSIENHDTVYDGREQRIARLADGSNPRSFYAASRAKVATGLLLAAPGIPQLFMGQEFLEDKQWNEDPAGSNLIDWAALDSGDKAMSDQLRFTQDFIRLRWNQPALRGQNINAYYSHNDNRIVAFHRWIEGQGLDVVVVASLNDNPFFKYQLGFPRGGRWAELLNSDVYQNWVNPLAVGNNGAIWADGGPRDNLPFSAWITIPPRAILVFGVASGQ